MYIFAAYDTIIITSVTPDVVWIVKCATYFNCCLYVLFKTPCCLL